MLRDAALYNIVRPLTPLLPSPPSFQVRFQAGRTITEATSNTLALHNMRSLTTSFLRVAATACVVLAASSSKPACPWTATLECKVGGEDSPEAALRQVDEHALRSMYCHTGCDFVVNHALPHTFSTYIRPTCSVHKDENHIEYKKFKSKDDKDEQGVKTRRSVGTKTSEPGQEMAKRDIDAYTVGSATFRFCCTDPHGNDYTEAAAKRIGLELSICKQLS